VPFLFGVMLVSGGLVQISMIKWETVRCSSLRDILAIIHASPVLYHIKVHIRRYLCRNIYSETI